MFSNNNQISEKQMRRTLVLPVFVSCIFVLPHIAAQLFDRYMLWGLLAFFVLSAGYCTVIYGIGRMQDKRKNRTVNNRKTVSILSMLRYTFRLAFYLLLAITILGEAQVPFMKEGGAGRISNLFVLLPLLLVAFYGANHRVEQVARINEMVFWVTFVPFVIMLAFGFQEVNWNVWMPEGNLSFWRLLLYGYLMVPFVLPVENYLRLKKDYNRERSTAVSYGAVLSMIGLACVLSMIIAGIYGVRGAAGEEMVTISIMRYIRLPFGVLERFDILMLWFFMTGCFVLICNTLFAIRQLYGEVFRGKGIWWIMLVSLGIALWLAHHFPKYEASLTLFLWYGAVIDLPLSILLPLVEMWGNGRLEEKKRIKQEKKRRKERLKKLNMTEKICMWLFMSCFCLVLLTGCGSDMRNVEQRDYATILLMSRNKDNSLYHIYLGIAKEHRVGEESQVEEVLEFDAGDLTQLKEEYERQRGKNLSLMHLKVLFWDKKAFVSEEELSEILYELDDEEEIAKTCPMLEINDVASWIMYVRKAEEPMGTYVSNLIQAFDQGSQKVPWLKDYLKYIREGETLIPCQLVKAQEGWKIQFDKTRYHFKKVE